MNEETLLLLDIGSGTQDVLLFTPGGPLENCPKFVLPAPARLVAARIRHFTAARRAVHLHGHNMGGGFAGAVREHVKAGLAMSATPQAAYSLGDDLDRVRSQGVELVESCPQGHEPVHLADFDTRYWQGLLGSAGLDMPGRVAAAAQDHGFHPGQSNRRARFKLWERLLLEADGRPEALVYDAVPQELTRLADLKSCIGGGPVADTGAAALMGALFVPEIEALANERGITVVNVGNSHTVAFLAFRGRILGVYEHHTGLLDLQGLASHLKRFRQGELGLDEVFDGNGHGCLTLDLPAAAQGFAPTFVLGPRRTLLQGEDAQFPAPGGDMMLAGCFGLLHGLRLAGLLPACA